jgi:hypothetical protein
LVGWWNATQRTEMKSGMHFNISLTILSQSQQSSQNKFQITVNYVISTYPSNGLDAVGPSKMVTTSTLSVSNSVKPIATFFPGSKN